jgi:transcriptional regulator with XRE-family HTH domain
MPRRKRTQLDHDFIYDRWKVFGEWLTMQRNNRGLTQHEAARAVKISRQQWMRYESGSKVLRKRMPAMAETLGVPLEKMLDRAGYKASPKRNAGKDLLGRIYDLLCAGNVDLAILNLLQLNDRIVGHDGVAGSRRVRGPKGGGVVATSFARAVVLLDELPDWLLELVLNAMKERINNIKHLTESDPQVKNLIRKKCIEALRVKSLIQVNAVRLLPSPDTDGLRHGETQAI